MAERRMFAKSIIDSDAFLDMPQSSQNLYFHLAMRADDEGFVSAPKSIMRLIGASEDDLKVLIAKRYILTFDSGIVVIKHWKINNYIQKDRFVPTTYTEERAMLTFDSKNAYIEKKYDENEMYTKCIQSVSEMDIQDKSNSCNSERNEDIIASLEGFGIVIDCNIPDWFDIDKLYAALNESSYLSQWKVLSKYISHWDKIVAGYYRDYKSHADMKKETIDDMEHNFTEEQLKAVISAFDI